MARPEKKTVDYFPHTATHGKTLFILQQKYSNDGYAFWFKLLESLARADHHFLDFNDEGAWQYFIANSLVDENTATDILNLLSTLNKITPEFWEHKVVYCQNFCDGIMDAYSRRNNHKPSAEIVSAYINSTLGKKVRAKNGKGKESKGKESKFIKPTLDDVSKYCVERGNSVDPERWLNHYTSNGWMVGKNKMKDWKAAVRTWEKSSFQQPNKIQTTEQDRFDRWID